MPLSRVLIVEESPADAERLRALLVENGYDATSAATGADALALIEAEPFDLVIGGATLPDMSGYDLCRAIRSQPASRGLSILLTTGLSDVMDVIRGLECGVDTFVVRPFQPDRLLARVAGVLADRQRRSAAGAVAEQTIRFRDQEFTIAADSEQVLNLLISTLDDAVVQQRRLLSRERELELAHADLSRDSDRLEERIQQVLESVPDVVYSLSPDRREAYYISPAITRLLGFTPEQFARDPWRLWKAAVAPPHRGRVRRAYSRASSTGRQETLEYPVIPLNGPLRWLEETIVPRRDADGRVVRLDGVARDITERRHLTDQLRLAQRMEAVGVLAGGVAHDFNNLLTAIQGNAELALLEIPEDSLAREDLTEICGIVERATVVTRQLLALGRKQVLEPQPVDLNELVENSSGLLRRFIGQDIALHTECGANRAVVWADPGQIDQVLMNLCLNSRQAMPEGGEIEIATAEVAVGDAFRDAYPWAVPGRYVCLSVRDTGPGMAADVADRIFEPFFTTKELGHGTGLGLSVVYGIVKQHGGMIMVDTAPGRGATFRLYIPATAHDVEPASAGDAAEAAGGGETILLVEDEATVRAIAVKHLRRLGYEVLEAEHGQDAIDQLNARGGRVDLVMLDVVMPVMGGHEAYQRIRERFPTMKFLFMTGYSPSTSHLHPISGIPGRILHKPFGVSELAVRVREVLGQPPA